LSLGATTKLSDIYKNLTEGGTEGDINTDNNWNAFRKIVSIGKDLSVNVLNSKNMRDSIKSDGFGVKFSAARGRFFPDDGLQPESLRDILVKIANKTPLGADENASLRAFMNKVGGDGHAYDAKVLTYSGLCSDLKNYMPEVFTYDEISKRFKITFDLLANRVNNGCLERDERALTRAGKVLGGIVTKNRRLKLPDIGVDEDRIKAEITELSKALGDEARGHANFDVINRIRREITLKEEELRDLASKEICVERTRSALKQFEQQAVSEYLMVLFSSSIIHNQDMGFFASFMELTQNQDMVEVINLLGGLVPDGDPHVAVEDRIPAEVRAFLMNKDTEELQMMVYNAVKSFDGVPPHPLNEHATMLKRMFSEKPDYIDIVEGDEKRVADLKRDLKNARKADTFVREAIDKQGIMLPEYSFSEGVGSGRVKDFKGAFLANSYQKARELSLHTLVNDEVLSESDKRRARRDREAVDRTSLPEKVAARAKRVERKVANTDEHVADRYGDAVLARTGHELAAVRHPHRR
jgi:hypothetical protein